MTNSSEKSKSSKIHSDAIAPKNKTRVYFLLAILLLLLIGCLWFFIHQPSAEHLYSKYVQHENILLDKTGDSNQIIKDAELVYNAGDYNQAIPLLIIINEKGINYDVILALGIAFLEQNELDKALEQFSSIYNSDVIIIDKALWYEAITYLKMGDKVTTLARLKVLQEEYPFYKTEETTKLIKKLK